MPKQPMITGAQVRMARAFLRWSAADLAARAKVGISTVQRIEAVDGYPQVSADRKWRTAARKEVVAAVRDTLIQAGIRFLPEGTHGIGIRARRH